MERQTLLERLRGAFPAAITPMTETGDVDHSALAENLHWMNTLGFAGYLLLGSTGEQVHLSEFERALVLEVGRRNIPDELILIAGTGLAGTRTTIDETKQAAKAGADVALIVTPSYYQKAMSAAALTEHYRAVADSSPIPILLYSVPGVTGITIPAAVVEELASHPNIIGMKNSGSDAQLASGYRAAAGAETFVILAGSAHAAAGFLLADLADGVILAAANVAPKASVALVQAARRGDLAASREHAATLARVSDEVGRFGIAGWKAGVEARGHHGGPVRSPLRNLTLEEKAIIIRGTT
ncbi:MAG: dihydrodipicolinate synthase family protein [Ardenticatenales bacterium]|nr:dihydrodipicolinate synthase family protein [Ardenticatenales bacterium]